MAKTRKQKKVLLDLYKQILDEYDFIMVELHTKIPANSVNQVRLALNNMGAKLIVLKNKVFEKVAKEKENFSDIKLENIKAIVVSKEDVLNAIKEFEKLKDYAKEELTLRGEDEEFIKSYRPFEYVMAYIDKQLYDTDQTKTLVTLPSKDELMGMLVGGLANVIRGFMNVLQGNTLKFMTVLNNIQEAKNSK